MWEPILSISKVYGDIPHMPGLLLRFPILVTIRQ
jgi:hypothetical protein